MTGFAVLWIDHSQRAIDFERIALHLYGQPLADYHLENVAGADVFDTLADRRFEVRGREVGLISQLRFTGGRDVRSRCAYRNSACGIR